MMQELAGLTSLTSPEEKVARVEAITQRSRTLLAKGGLGRSASALDKSILLEEEEVAEKRAAPPPSLLRSVSLDASEQVRRVGLTGSRGGLCMFCCQRPKDASLIHGRLGHQVCCYPCAKKLWKKQARCPVCRRKVDRIIRIIQA